MSTPEKLKQVAQKIAARRREGLNVAVVVSAMGDTTDRFCRLARAVCEEPPCRELDILLTAGEQISSSLLSMAIQDLGLEAISLNGPQAGIVTTPVHNRARILEVRPQRVRAELEQGRVVVVAGFQGLSYSGEVTTLGRGGSDTSAVALAAALQAERCEIYSDVDGIYSSDPRLVPSARRLPELSYQEMQEMARGGAKVLNADAVEFARRSNLEIHALSTFQDGPGTVIRESSKVQHRVIGVTGRSDLFRVQLLQEDLTHQVRELWDESDIFRAEAHDYLLSGENVADLASFRRRLESEFRSQVVCSQGLGSVSVVGSGWDEPPHHLARMVEALGGENITPLEGYAEPHSLTCLLPAEAVRAANRILHQQFIDAEVPA